MMFDAGKAKVFKRRGGGARRFFEKTGKASIGEALQVLDNLRTHRLPPAAIDTEQTTDAKIECDQSLTTATAGAFECDRSYPFEREELKGKGTQDRR